MGHEFTGLVKEIGSQVKTVKVGDRIVSPFTVSWYGSQRTSMFQVQYSLTNPVLNVSIARTATHHAVPKVCSSVVLDWTEPRPSSSECLSRMEPL